MNRVETAATRPRMASGVINCTRVWRTKTLSMSAPPRKARATTDSQMFLDRANTTVAAPNTATPANMVQPALRWMGRAARISPTSTAPRAGPERKMPKPSAPTCSTSRAKAGSRAVAPPRITAARSREMAPNTTRLVQT